MEARSLGARGVRARWLALAAVVHALAFTPAGAQGVHYGVVMDVPRVTLDSAWREDAQQVERAYCVVGWSYGVYHVAREPVQDDTVYRVFNVKTAAVRGAGPSSVDFECPQGVPELHVHTPTTCTQDDVRTCVVGGLNAYSCQPSRQDLEKLARRGDPFAVIQCDRRAFRFYYPSEYGAAATLVAQRRTLDREARQRAGNRLPNAPPDLGGAP
jgi:hypothetical protein